MKNFSTLRSYLPLKTLAIATGLLAAVVLALGSVTAGFGPDRPTKVYEGAGTPGFDYATFNSFTEVPSVGDERSFFSGKIAGEGGGFYDPVSTIRDGDEVLVRVYVHNGADEKYNADGSGIAKNTRVRVDLPEGISQNHQATAYISADNTNPQQIYDTLDFSAENGGFFELEPVEGSATIKTNFIDQAIDLNQLITDGVLIGDDALDGEIRGCFEYTALVTFKLKVKMPRYEIQKSVRFEGQTSNDWKESVTADSGDTVEWRIEFKNTGNSVLENVAIFDELPDNMEMVSGSTKLYNTAYPGGVDAGSDAIISNSLDIGDYAPGSNAFVLFKAKVDPQGNLKCGTHELLNLAYATPRDFGSINDGAKVVVETDRECPEPEQPVYECTSLTAEKLNRTLFRFTVKAKAEGGATISSYGYDFGDSSELLVTDKSVVEHNYTKDGNYNVSATVKFNVNGETKEDVCTTKVSVTSEQPPVTPPEQLPDTGIGSALAGFFGTSALFASARNWFTSRKLVRSALRGES